MNEREVLMKINELSNSIHERTQRGGAELLLLSERVFKLLENRIANGTKNVLLGEFLVLQPSEWTNPPIAPCDIRAIYFSGNVDFNEVDDENAKYQDPQKEEISEEIPDDFGGEDTHDFSMDNVQMPSFQMELDDSDDDSESEDVIEEYTFE